MPGFWPLKTWGQWAGTLPGAMSHSRPARSPVASLRKTWPSLVAGSHQDLRNRCSISMRAICPALVAFTRAATTGTSSGLNSRRG